MGEIPVRTNDSNHYFFEVLFNALVKATRYTIWTYKIIFQFYYLPQKYTCF